MTIRYRTTRSFGNIAQKGQNGAKGGYWKFEAPGGDRSPACSRVPTASGVPPARAPRSPTASGTPSGASGPRRRVTMYVDGAFRGAAQPARPALSLTLPTSRWAARAAATRSRPPATTSSATSTTSASRRAPAVRPTPRPDAAATANCTGLICSLSGAGSTDTDGAIQSYAWDFGDGTTAISTGSVPSTSHTYAAAGTYQVSLTVTDDRGATDTTLHIGGRGTGGRDDLLCRCRERQRQRDQPHRGRPGRRGARRRPAAVPQREHPRGHRRPDRRDRLAATRHARRRQRHHPGVA